MKHHLEFIVTLALLRPWSCQCHFCYGLINIVSCGLWNILQTKFLKLKLAWNLHYVCLEFHQGRSKFLVNVYSASIVVGSKIISKIVWCAAHSRVVRRSVGPPRLDCWYGGACRVRRTDCRVQTAGADRPNPPSVLAKPYYRQQRLNSPQFLSTSTFFQPFSRAITSWQLQKNSVVSWWGGRR